MQDNRNNKMAVDKDLMIDIDPEILKVFEASKTVSSEYSFIVVVCCSSC
jgi:hypothetical protein